MAAAATERVEAVEVSSDRPATKWPRDADVVVDELIGDEFDWRRLVVKYPKTSISIAAIGGYLVGTSRGRELLAVVSAYAAASLTSNVNSLLDEDLF